MWRENGKRNSELNVSRAEMILNRTSITRTKRLHTPDIDPATRCLLVLHGSASVHYAHVLSGMKILTHSTPKCD